MSSDYVYGGALGDFNLLLPVVNYFAMFDATIGLDYHLCGPLFDNLNWNDFAQTDDFDK